MPTRRRVKVVNVSLGAVELQYLDSPAPDTATTFATAQSAMLASIAMFRVVIDAP
jgi:hypothetical protein